MSIDSLTYSVTEAAKLLGIGRRQAYEAVKLKQLPALRIGNSIRVPKRALHEMIEKAGEVAA